ncbi:MAG: fibrobacter succinogenes major paralogous domain-containing protein [Bacteroidales bacterium]|nr:fibrobacter succinogenes major paralogous domain-containing protein [Bacteroidales bacterium]
MSHFLWSPDKSVAVGTSTSVSGSTSDVFFTNDPEDETKPNANFHVNGETGTNQWRTLSNAEWNYLLNSRANATSLRAWKELDDGTHKGLVILPDDTDALVMSSITSTANLASSGAVFLPAAGNRNVTDVNYVGSYGYYWSSTPDKDNGGLAFIMYFCSDSSVSARLGLRYLGNSVRLVR